MKFKCGDCLKAFALGKYKNHKRNGECKRDGKGGDEDEEMDEAIEAYQPNANFK